MRRRLGEGGFTLVELSVTMGVLVLLVFLFTQLLNSAATITILGHKQMDADSQARQLLDRMAVDFAQMVKRSDVDYYLKSSWFVSGTPTPAPNGARFLVQRGNDTIAFYSTVPGYYPSTGLQSPLSLVSYRVNAQNKLERMGKGLVWNGVSTTDTPVVFMPVPLASPIPTPELPSITPNPLPTPAWRNVADPTLLPTPDPSTEVIGPQVFRFEYYYLLKGQTAPACASTPTPTPYTSMFSDTPWDTRICPSPTPTPPSVCCHIAPTGMQDIAAVVVVIAVIDPATRVLVSDCQLAQLNGGPLPQNCTTPAQYPVLIDWGQTGAGYPSQTDWQTTPGLLLAQWRAALNDTTNGLPPPAISGIRVYERYFYLNQ